MPVVDLAQEADAEVQVAADAVSTPMVGTIARIAPAADMETRAFAVEVEVDNADRLLLLTDVSGVKNGAGEVVTELKAADVEAMTHDGVIIGGMIPKTETALAAVRSGVRACTIVDGRVPNAVLLELFTDHGAGSMIRP